MPNYYNLTTNELVTLAPETLAAWVANGNPKSNDYAPLPDKPSENATWGNGEWITPSAPTYTAEEWLENQAYTPLRLLTCLDLEGKLRSKGGTSPKLTAIRQWLDEITLAAAFNPNAVTSTWPSAPFVFDVVVQEAITQLIIVA